MAENRLNIIKVLSEDPTTHSYQNSQNRRKKEREAKFERLWLIDPERFNPLRNCMERERIKRTWQLLIRHVTLADHPKVVDIGCAAGVFSRRLRDAGAQVDAIDIAENALKQFRQEGAQNITLKQEVMPQTSLTDEGYDAIICTELIAELNKEEYRLFFAELSRLIKANGYLICSSPIDIYTTDGVERLKELAQTEFDIVEEKMSYHALYLRLKYLLLSPSRFVKGWQSKEDKTREISRLKGISRLWYQLNSSFFLAWWWWICTFLLSPVNRGLNNNTKILLFLEKICCFISNKEGISHYLFIAKRRPLPSFNPEEVPLERPKRKEVWD